MRVRFFDVRNGMFRTIARRRVLKCAGEPTQIRLRFRPERGVDAAMDILVLPMSEYVMAVEGQVRA